MKRQDPDHRPNKRPAIGSRIVHVVGYFPPHLGGMEVVASEVSREQVRSGRTVDVLTSTVGARKQPRLEKDWNYTVRRLRAVEFAHTPFMPTLLLQLFRIKKPAVIHLHLSQAYLPELVWLTAKIRRIPYVAHVHLIDVQPSGPFGFLLPLYNRLIQPFIMRGATQVIALSPKQAELVKRRYQLSADKVYYLPNGVSQDFLDIGKKPRRPHKPLRLLYIGRIARQKRLERLVEALASVSSPVQLTIVGDGEDRAKVEKLAADLTLTNVTFTGALYGKAVLEEYRKADVFVLPSDQEGMSLSLLEAMGAGLPVIGSDAPGIREHLQDGGVLVAKPSPQTFAKAIDDFYKHRTRYARLSRAAYHRASEYSWSTLVRRLEDRYRTIERRPAISPWHIGRIGLTVLTAAWWLAFLLLRADPAVPAIPVNILGFSWLLVVPGMLSIISLGLRSLSAWGKLSLTVGLSLLELMGAGLLGNTVLQWVHVARPLDTPYLIADTSVLFAALLATVWIYAKGWGVNIYAGCRSVWRQRSTWGFALLPFALVAMSCLGAISLNNGGSDLWTMGMLVGAAAFSLVIVAESRRLNDSTIAVGLYCLALSLLLMTSLRGWVTTGHDIQQEYQVFELARRHGVWQIQAFRNPYNACLSITVLPTVFANLLRLADPYVFKILFQAIFAFCPVIMYLFVRKWTTAALAFLSALYFIAFPTFFTDMPFLNRQEIAFVFFSLMLYVLFQDQLKLALRRILFLALGAGLILSHYSTTYSVLVILLIGAGTWPVLVTIGRFGWIRRLFKRAAPALGALHVQHRESRRITVSMVGLLAVGSFVWTVMLTDTGGSTILIARQTVTAALQSFKKEDTPKSNDTSYNLFSFSSVPPAEELQQFNDKTVLPQRTKSPGLYYPAVAVNKYPVAVAGDTVQPLTALGRYVSHLGLPVVSFNFAFRQTSAKLLQILVLSGFIYVLLRRTYTRLLDSDYVALAVGGVIFVALQVVLPVLSVEYGLLRAFQQSLLLLGLFTVLGSLLIFAWLPGRKWRIAAAALLAVIFLLSSTGVLTQVVGGYYAQLNLANAGVYYDNYYTQPQELSAVAWLNRLSARPGARGTGPVQLQMEDFTYSRLSTYTRLNPVGDIYPGLINKNAYVFLGYATVRRHEATVAYNSDLITYKYPIGLLDSQKNLVYSNGGAEIYK